VECKHRKKEKKNTPGDQAVERENRWELRAGTREIGSSMLKVKLGELGF